ncbi:MAG: beta-mannosidase, partial [Sphingobacteriaceae bacterium]
AMAPKMNWDTQRDYTSKFYSCEPCINDYNIQLNYIIKHVNKYTKKAYRDDPTIMAWELANEPRPMRPEANEAYKKWTSSTAAYIKSIDKMHLVTLGAEGVMGTEDVELFKQTHAIAAVDYLTIHIWPKNWGWFSDTSIVAGLPNVIAKTKAYIDQHITIANELKKPLVVEEFGLPRDSHSFDPAHSTNARDTYYSSIFTQLLSSRKTGGVLAGSNFWAFGGTARPIPGQLMWKDGDDMMGDPPQEEQGLNAVFDSDSIWKLITKNTALLK